jgi:Glucose / Sorbosone dehydrogenase
LLLTSTFDGNLVGGRGVELYSVGLRNPFGLVLHSNGNMYTNDNGPNFDFGDTMLGCNGERMVDVEDFDKLIRLEEGGYYGHPNPKRAKNDARQCTWHRCTAPSGNGYTAPMMRLESATGGMIEFRTNHFGGQLRGNLIYSQYNGALHRVIISADCKGVLPASNPALPLVGDIGLAVTQAPSGELIEARFQDGHVFFHRPVEAATDATLVVTGVFPYRGVRVGGFTVHIYGTNSDNNRQDSDCASRRIGVHRHSREIVPGGLTLPSGLGTVDVQLTLGATTVTFPKFYRYIAV